MGDSQDNIRVFVRIKPLGEGENGAWEHDETAISLQDNSEPPYGFDGVIGPDAENGEVYEKVRTHCVLP